MKEHSEYSQYLQCGECPLKFESQDALEKHHVDTHVFHSVFSFIESSNEEHEECDVEGVAIKLQSHKFQCEECHFCSNSELNLRNHIFDNVHRNVLRFSCNVCDFKSFYKNYVKRHVLKVHDIEKDTKNFINKIGGDIKSEEKKQKQKLRYQCYECEASFRTRSGRCIHRKTKHGISKQFSCEDCNFSTNLKYRLRNHVDFHHNGVIRFMCNLCDYKSYYKLYVKKHQACSHFGEKKEIIDIDRSYTDTSQREKNHKPRYQCYECEASFRTTSGRSAHRKSKHGSSEQYSCENCDFSTKVKYRLKIHVDFHHNGVIRFKCNLCDYKSYYKRYVKKHQACSHDGEKQEIIDINRSYTDTSQRENPIDPRFGCNLCDKKSRKSVTIRKHQAKFHPDDNFKVVKIGDKKEKKSEIVKIVEKKEKKEKIQCSICSMEFESQRQTILHYKQEHPQDKVFKCRTCNFGSNSSQNLKFHEERHKEGAKSVDIKVNPCFVCNVECETKNKRLEHYRREHPTERIFKCRICDYGSNKISSFKVHEKRHGREKELKLDEECHLCKKKFQYFIEKQAHYRSEHPTEKIFSCEFCDFGSNRKGNFKHHMEHIHVDGVKSVSKKIVRVKLNGAQLNNCKVCEEKFQSRRKLVAHFRKEHPDETLFKCESCDYSSNYLANIKTHSESTHTQELRKCEVCEFSTRWNTTFLQHMRDKHQVIQRPRKCVTVTESMICHECGFEAKTKEQQRRHTHSLYKCYECEATFHTKSGRFLHRKTKHQKVTFSCDKCNFRIHHKYNLEKHQRIKHGS